MIKNLKEVFLAEKILTVSNFIKSKLEALEIPPEVVTIYPPVSPSFKPLADKNKIRKELGLPFDKKLILNVSSNDPRKNLPAVLKTIKLLGDNYELVRIGKRLGEGYSFINVDDTTVNKVYNACDALLFPSLDEGFGYPVVESMTAGLPVVASKIDIFEEIAKDAAFLVNPTPEKLSEAIIRVVSESEKYQKKGFIRSKEFSFENFKLKIKEFYKEF